MRTSMTEGSRALQLLDQYTPGEHFFFATLQHTLLAEGCSLRVLNKGAKEWKELAGQATEILSIHEKTAGKPCILVGAVPFDSEDPVQLYIPSSFMRSDGLADNSEMAKEKPEHTKALNMSDYIATPVPDPEEYQNGVVKLLKCIKEGRMNKTVLARSLHIACDHPIEASALLRQLALHNTSGYTFAVPIEKQRMHEGDGQKTEHKDASITLLGASPELLISKKGLEVISKPLAGSIPRSDDPEEDRKRAANLLESAKDLHEHAFVTHAIAEALKPFCKKLDVPDRPSLVATETMWHLATTIRGELISSDVSSLELVYALHPTPAVCGTPTSEARTLIKEIETFERGYYSGAVGWCDASGDGEWAVTIRCAEVEGNSVRLFAGAGIVAGSRPEEELRETSAKMGTFLQAIGFRNESETRMNEEGA
ncbi:isochorismate synthase DhbC [Neobacillus mesonae]|nr:isochorismate synthase DhbC [Neobacillus mesonae]